MTAFITGVNNVSVSIKEYRDQEITAEYLRYMQDLQNIFNTPTGTITDAQYDAALNDLKKLRDLAVKGFATPAGGTQQITQQMASHINLIFKSFQAVGITPDSYMDILPATKTQLIKDWKSLTYFNLGQLITDARTKYDSVSTLIATNAVVGYDPNGIPILAGSPAMSGLLSATAARSLQSMVELEYVKTGNDVIFDSLVSLENATKKTGDALGLLTQVQQVLNLVQTPGTPTFTWPIPDNNDSRSITDVYGQSVTDALVAAGVIPAPSVGPAAPTIANFNAFLATNPSLSDTLKGIVQSGINAQIQGAGLPINVGGLGGNIVGVSTAFPWPPQLVGTTQRTYGYPVTGPIQASYFINNDSNFGDIYGGAAVTALQSLGYFGTGNTSQSVAYLVTLTKTDQAKYQAIYKAIASSFFTQRYAYLGGPDAIGVVMGRVDALMPQLNDMANALGDRGTKDTLANKLSLLWSNWYAIRNDYSNSLGYGNYDVDRTYSWLLDGQNLSVSNSAYNARFGKVQDQLTNAIRAGESLNDTQKEGVRRYMLLFEEFYKSASAILTKVSQIIEKMAQGISR